MAICRSFPDKTSMIQLTLPIHYIVSERKKYIETSDLQKGGMEMGRSDG